ncbi:Integral membrane protein [Scedosporium apiospermum]|uniref:Integral membrane protein n=1 Tax=Pseudallescheria apiosperma TaxID=563466 RepID=A0A084G2K6_PSEDA|nr:Integral membrane protein [Scedosporium apiospermum]KEZ41568.1 Integral membrane protein [Scedosporium apiospermum]
MPRTPPPEVIASWPAPNFVNPETRGPVKDIVTITLWVIVTGILTLRIYTRRYISRRVGWDDVLVTASYVTATAFLIVGIIVEHGYGWAKHIWDIPVDDVVTGFQLALVSFSLFDFATTFTKLSVLALVYRLATPVSNRIRKFVIFLIVLNLLGMISYLVVLFTQCRPISDYWEIFKPADERNCLNEGRGILIAGTYNTAMDFILVILPMFVVLRSNTLPRRQMMVVMALFATGWVACLAGIVRTYLMFIMTTSADFDMTWHSWISWLASAIELFLGIICVSIPATKPFFVRYVPRLFDSMSPRSNLETGTTKNAESENEVPIVFVKEIQTRPRLPPDLNKPLPPLANGIRDLKDKRRAG